MIPGVFFTKSPPPSRRMGFLALPTSLPTHDDKNENYYMMTARYRKMKIINVVGLPLRSVLDFLLEIEAIGVAHAR